MQPQIKYCPNCKQTASRNAQSCAACGYQWYASVQQPTQVMQSPPPMPIPQQPVKKSSPLAWVFVGIGTCCGLPILFFVVMSIIGYTTIKNIPQGKPISNRPFSSSVSLIKIGMSPQEVKSLLGKPDTDTSEFDGAQIPGSNKRLHITPGNGGYFYDYSDGSNLNIGFTNSTVQDIGLSRPGQKQISIYGPMSKVPFQYR